MNLNPEWLEVTVTIDGVPYACREILDMERSIAAQVIDLGLRLENIVSDRVGDINTARQREQVWRENGRAMGTNGGKITQCCVTGGIGLGQK